MTDHVYRITDVVRTSPDGADHAIRNALRHAGQTVCNTNWLEVTQKRGHVNESRLAHSRSSSASASGRTVGTMASDSSPRAWRSRGIGLGSAVGEG